MNVRWLLASVGLIIAVNIFQDAIDWIVDNVDFSEAFFSSMDTTFSQQTCMVLHNDEDPLFPSHYYIYNNYPNPFNPVTTFACGRITRRWISKYHYL